VAGFKSEYPAGLRSESLAGFELECMADFIGIRTLEAPVRLADANAFAAVTV
jgi:hypothetical protein